MIMCLSQLILFLSIFLQDKLLRKLDKIDTTEPSPTKDEEVRVVISQKIYDIKKTP